MEKIDKQLNKCEKTFSMFKTNQELISRIFKELLKIKKKNTTLNEKLYRYE